MVTRYNSTDATPDDVGEFVHYSDYRILTERLDTLEAAMRSSLAAAFPVPIKTADEQTVSDFILALAKKTK